MRPRAMPPSALAACALALFAASLAGCGSPRAGRGPPSGDSVAGAATPGAAARTAPPLGAPSSDGVACPVVLDTAALPASLHESSGVAASRRHPGVFWTHNDSGGRPVVYAVDATGRLLGSVTILGAANIDWEDIALAPCPDGAGDCLTIADTGDNAERRQDIVLYRVPEPEPSATETPPAVRIPLRYPDHPRDTEALYVLPDRAAYLVSKGRSGPIELYRVPPAGGVLEPVERIAPRPAELGDEVTAAAARPDGRVVAVRTYAALYFFRVGPDGHLTPMPPRAGIDLASVAQVQGEGLDLLQDGTAVLTSEAGPGGTRGAIARIRCTIP